MKTDVDGNAVDSRLEMLLDEREIKNCVLRYCHGTDRLDWRTVTECYLPQASDDHGAFQGGPAEFASWLAAKSKYRGAKQHYVANQLVEISGDNAVCVHRRNGSPLMKGADVPGMPIVSSTMPSSEHLRTVWSPSSVR